MAAPRDINMALCAALNIDGRDVVEVRIRLRPNKWPSVLVVRQVVDLQAKELKAIQQRYTLQPVDSVKPDAMPARPEPVPFGSRWCDPAALDPAKAVKYVGEVSHG